MKPKFQARLFRPALLQAAALFTTSFLWQASAADVTWDTISGNGVVDGGLGTWDTGTANWTTNGGVSNINWANGTDTAVFGGSAGIVSLGIPITAGGITLNSTGYTVTGNTLTLGGTTPTVTIPSGTATIGAIIDGTNGLKVVGPGIVVLNPASTNLYSGTTTVTNGQLSANYQFQTANDVINPASPLVLNGGAFAALMTGSATLTETVSGTTLASGHSSLQVNKGGATGAGLLNLGAVTRNPGATLNLHLSHNGGTTRRIQSSSWAGAGATIVDSGVAYATFISTGSTGTSSFTGDDWAAYSGTTVQAAAYTASTANTLAGNANIATSTDTTLAADATITTLRANLAEARSVNINGNILTTGGILIGGAVANNSTTITGGTLRSAASAANKDLVVITNNSGITFIASTIANAAAGATGLTKSGLGTLSLSGTNSYTGPTIINKGSLTSAISSALASTSSISVGSGAALTVSYGGVSSYTNPQIDALLLKTTFADATAGFGFDTTDATGGTANYAGGYSGSTGLAKSGTGTLVITGANTHTGTTTVFNGTLKVANIAALGGTTFGTVVQSGGGLLLEGGITIAGEALSLSGDGVSQTGALRSLSGSNSWTGAISIDGATGRVNADAGTLTLGAVGATAANALLLSGNGTINVNGIVSGAAAVTVEDLLGDGTTSGTMTLGGVNTNTGATTVASGNLSLSGNRTANSGAFFVGTTASKTGTLNVSNGDFSTGTGDIQIAAGASTTGIVNQTNGSITTGSTGSTNGRLLIGAGTPSTGTYNLSGGSLTADGSGSTGLNNANVLVLGTNNSSTATFNLSGGSLVVPAALGYLQIGRSNSTSSDISGTFNQTGGMADITNLGMGGPANSNGTSVLNITAGTFSVTTSFATMAAGANSSASILIGGAADVTLPEFPTARGAGASATITFDGGTLRPAAASANYMSGLTDEARVSPVGGATIQDGGVTISVATGNDIVIAQSLLTHPDSPGGGLTKSGDGILALSGDNTYTGTTNVNAGTLGLAGGSQASPIIVADNAFLGFTIDSTTSSTSTVTFNATAKVRITGTPIAASYTLMTTTGINGTPVLESPIDGYELVKDGTTLKLNSTGGSFSSWASAFAAATPPLTDTTATGDPDKDGLTNLTEYALGLDPRFSSVPAGSITTGTVSFTKGSEAIANADVSWVIQKSATLNNDWTDEVTQAPGNASTTISYNLPVAQPKVFARLKVVKVP